MLVAYYEGGPILNVEVFVIWPQRDISRTPAYISTSGRRSRR
jgi:hypothetical protein